MLRRAAVLLLAVPLVCSAQGLRLKPEESLLQARVNLLAGDDSSGSRLLGAQLLGDYYLLQGSGLRLSGGLLMGPVSLLGSGLAPASRGLLGVGHRRLLGGSSDEASLNQPYLGVGYSRYGSSWGVSADLGVAVNASQGGLRLGGTSAFTQSLDDTVRRLQWTPMLQFGVSYRF
jgi:hypothetical protein